eukprot:545937_1
MSSIKTAFLFLFMLSTLTLANFGEDAVDCNKLWLNINPLYYHAPDNCLQQRTNMTVDSYRFSCTDENMTFWYGSDNCDGTGTIVDMATLYSTGYTWACKGTKNCGATVRHYELTDKTCDTDPDLDTADYKDVSVVTNVCKPFDTEKDDKAAIAWYCDIDDNLVYTRTWTGIDCSSGYVGKSEYAGCNTNTEFYYKLENCLNDKDTSDTSKGTMIQMLFAVIAVLVFCLL